MPLAAATVKNTSHLLASSEAYQEIEGNIYFPPSALRTQDNDSSSSTSTSRFTLRPSALTTSCPWKGEAHYFDLCVDGEAPIVNAAWYYPAPLPGAVGIKDFVAFYQSKVTVEKK